MNWCYHRIKKKNLKDILYTEKIYICIQFDLNGI